MSPERPPEMGIAELAAHAGVTPRTIRYYVAEGLLPPPEGTGPRRTYTTEHLLRLEAIKRLKEAFLPLAEIRNRLSGLSSTDLERLATADPTTLPPVGAAHPQTALEYLASILPSPQTPRPSAPSGTPFTAGPSHEQPSMLLGRQASPARPRPEPRIELPQPVSSRPGQDRLTHAQSLSPGQGQAEGEDWRRVVLAPGVELQYQPSADPRREAAIAHLIRAARSLLGGTEA